MNTENAETKQPEGPSENDMVLTPAIQKQLDEYRGFTDNPIIFWTPILIRKFRPKKEWPVFKLELRTGLDFVDAENELGYATRDGLQFNNSGEVRKNRIQKKCLAWKNWKDRNGNLIPSKKEKEFMTDEDFDKMGNMLQKEMYSALSGEDFLTPEELAGLEF